MFLQNVLEMYVHDRYALLQQLMGRLFREAILLDRTDENGGSKTIESSEGLTCWYGMVKASFRLGGNLYSSMLSLLDDIDHAVTWARNWKKNVFFLLWWVFLEDSSLFYILPRLRFFYSLVLIKPFDSFYLSGPRNNDDMTREFKCKFITIVGRRVISSSVRFHVNLHYSSLTFL